MCSVTTGGIDSFDIKRWLGNQFQLGGTAEDPRRRILAGQYSGLDILGGKSDCPIIVTTRKTGIFTSLCLIGRTNCFGEFAFSIFPTSF